MGRGLHHTSSTQSTAHVLKHRMMMMPCCPESHCSCVDWRGEARHGSIGALMRYWATGTAQQCLTQSNWPRSAIQRALVTLVSVAAKQHVTHTFLISVRSRAMAHIDGLL